MPISLRSEGYTGLIANLLTDWVRAALVDPRKLANSEDRRVAWEEKRQALYDFEVAKRDPEGFPLLELASQETERMALMGLIPKGICEADILDELLERAGVAWDYGELQLPFVFDSGDGEELGEAA